MAIRTLDGRMKETSADIPELTGEALEEFKKTHRGMTPYEYGWYSSKYAIIRGNYRVWTKLIEDCVKKDRTIDDIYAEIEAKKSDLPSSIRKMVTIYYGTDEGKKMIHEIMSELIKLLADRAEAGKVIALIQAIGKYEDTDECRSRIKEARTAFDALTDDQKGLVSTYGMLVAAENGGKEPEKETNTPEDVEEVKEESTNTETSNNDGE